MPHTATFRMRLQHKERLTDPSCADVVVKLAFSPLPHQNLPERFLAGQFVRISIPDRSELQASYFAIASAPYDNSSYEFVIKAVSPLSETLTLFEEGDLIEIEGPMGKGFDLSSHKGKNVILMGVGTGIAPLRSVWLDLIEHREDYGTVTIYAGFLTSVHHLLTDELENLGEHDIQVSVSLATADDQWNGPVGYVQHALEVDKPEAENTVVCIAGMSVMVDACTETLVSLGFDQEQILLNF